MITLRQITFDNLNTCIKLETHEEQKAFVATNICSLAEAYVALTTNECMPMPFGIYHEDTMVGFIMLAYEKADEDRQGMYDVWRIMIDKKYQSKGYGRQAMVAGLDLIKTFPHGPATGVSISYEPHNVVAKKLYASLGFVETGKIVEGEAVAELAL